MCKTTVTLGACWDLRALQPRLLLRAQHVLCLLPGRVRDLCGVPDGAAPPHARGVRVRRFGAGVLRSAQVRVGGLRQSLCAIPSMHMGFALMIGGAFVRLSRRRWVRAAWLAYPAGILWVVVATGNHFWLDAVAGAIVALAGALCAHAPRSTAPPAVGLDHSLITRRHVTTTPPSAPQRPRLISPETQELVRNGS